MRGAALGTDGLGKPILAMPSVTARNESKIVPFIKQGDVVLQPFPDFRITCPWT